MPFLISPGIRLYEFLITDGRQLCAMSRENFGVYVIWSPQISRRQTWMDHRRQEGRRGRSADHPERSSLGLQPGWDERRHLAIWHDAVLRRRSQKHRERSKDIMPRQNA